MPLAERLSSKLHSCPLSFASRSLTVHFSDNLSTLGIMPRFTSRRKGSVDDDNDNGNDSDNNDDILY